MSGENSSGLDEPAERMALLDQRKRGPNSTVVDMTTVLAYQDDFVSQRLDNLLSRCHTDDEIDRELWDDLEIHRRSAHTYINEYLDTLQQVHEERCTKVYEVEDLHDEAIPTDLALRNPNSNASAMTRAEWRLKISHDSLTRDLLAMHKTLEILKMRTPTLSRGGLSIYAFWGPALSLLVIMWSGWRFTETVVLLAFNTFSLAAYYYSSPGMRKWLRTKSIERYQGQVEALLRRLNKNELGEEDRAGLSGIWYWMVIQFRK